MHEASPDALEPAAGESFTGHQTTTGNKTPEAEITSEAKDTQKSVMDSPSDNRPYPSANSTYQDLNQ
jgi:hypothetical protein